jgi:predicted transcriptional regulator
MRIPITLTVPDDVAQGLDQLAKIEERSRSDTASRLLRAGLAARSVLPAASAQRQSADAAQ